MKKPTESYDAKDDRPLVPIAGIVYGDIIYWTTIAGTVLVIIGTVMSFTMSSNYLDISAVMSNMLQGKKTEEIWMAAAGHLPQGHWYLSALNTGSGITMAGMALGVFSVTPGIFGAAYFLFKEKHRVFGTLAVIAGIITIVAMIGIDIGAE